MSVPHRTPPRGVTFRATTAFAALTLGAGLVVALAPAAQAATGCSVVYGANSWNTGFTGTVAVTNLGAPVTSWTLTWTFPGNQQITQSWGASYAQSGAAVTLTNAAWNGSLATGATVTPGFNATYSGTNVDPTSFALNGVTCTGSVTPTDTPTTDTPTSDPTATTGEAPELEVSGNEIVTAAGDTYRLLGVNRSGGEFTCIQGRGMWDGPVDQASVTAMKTWNVHAVRIPLNEECWLGTSDVPSGGTSGAAYRAAVEEYVDLLVANGINPILDLHWTYGTYTGAGAGCADLAATCQKPMPDMQYTPAFWSSVATTFKGDDAVVFDLFNEPYPDAANGWSDATAAWTCLRDGGTCTGIGYEVAGMQTLVDAVRATGATNVVMVSGLTWTNDLTQWLTYAPDDPLDNIVASWHSYNFNACVTSACWDAQIAPVAASVPLVVGELGQNTCAHDYVDPLMAWAESHDLSYLAWTWNTWGCSAGNVLITDYDGTPTSTYGEGVKAHLLTVTP